MKQWWAQLCDTTTTKKNVWHEIGKCMVDEHSYNLGNDPGGKCHQKWKNMMKKIKEYAKLSQQTGSGADVLQSKPEHYVEIMDILGL